MYSQNKAFQQRVAQAETYKAKAKKKRARIAYDQRPDGLLVPIVVHDPRRIPWKTLMLGIVCLVVLKGFIYAHFGADMVIARVADLENGNISQKVYAYALQPDRVSGWIATQIDPYLPERQFRVIGQ